ncbi:MAG: methyltransferase domain-containing protein [Hyphomicrobiales bacterium]|nr:methyltransferase domain-containing protein [Hyphomicrobiales bacterium]
MASGEVRQVLEGSDDQASEREATAQFVLNLRGRGIGNLDVLRAMESVARRHFVPHHYRDLANRDLAIPISCGQTMPAPWLAARMAEALDLGGRERVLEIGTGSGYVTAILARLAGHVVSIERYQSLTLAARTRLAHLRADNAEVHWADGLTLTGATGSFDRIIIHAVMTGAPTSFLPLLKQGGHMMFARNIASHGLQPWQRLVTLSRNSAGEIAEIDICDCHLRPLTPGKSAEL